MPYSIAPYPPSPAIQVNGTPAAATAISFGSGLTSALSGGVLTVTAATSVAFTVTTSTTFAAAQFAGYSQITLFVDATAGAILITLPTLSTLDSVKWIKLIDITGQQSTHATTLTLTGGGMYVYSGISAPTALPSPNVFQAGNYSTQGVTLRNTGTLLIVG